MKYISADKLLSEIEKILSRADKEEKQAFLKKDGNRHIAAVIKTAVCAKIKKLVTSLQQEQPEVDIEKEIDKWRDKNFDKSQDVKYSGENITRKSQIDIARYFYDLGRRASDITSDITSDIISDINARKED